MGIVTSSPLIATGDLHRRPPISDVFPGFSGEKCKRERQKERVHRERSNNAPEFETDSTDTGASARIDHYDKNDTDLEEVNAVSTNSQQEELPSQHDQAGHRSIHLQPDEPYGTAGSGRRSRGSGCYRFLYPQQRLCSKLTRCHHQPGRSLPVRRSKHGQLYP